MKPIEEKTREELIEQIRRLQDRVSLMTTERLKKQDAYVARLADYRKAKALANARADKAEAALKAAMSAFFGKEETPQNGN